MITGILLLAISAAGFTVFAVGMYRFFRKNPPEIRKENFEEEQYSESSSLSGFGKKYDYQKGVIYSAYAKDEMTYGEIVAGIKNKDPQAAAFVMIASGFLTGLLCLLAGTGSILVHYGTTDGWFLIGFSAVFSALAAYAIISSRIDHSKTKKYSENHEEDTLKSSD